MLERFGCVLVWGGAWDCCNCQLCRSHFLSLFPNMERHQWESIRTSTFSKYSVVQCAVCIVPHADHSKEWKLCNSCVDRERPSKAAKCRWYHHCTPNTLLQAGGHSKCASIDVQCQAQADTFLRFSICNMLSYDENKTINPNRYVVRVIFARLCTPPLGWWYIIYNGSRYYKGLTENKRYIPPH